MVYFLNAMKMTFSFYDSWEDIMDMDDKSLKEDLACRIRDSFPFIFPFIPKNLLESKFCFT